MSKKDLAYNAKLKHANPLDLMFGGEDPEREESSVIEKTSISLDRERIKLDPTQPRRYFDPKRLEELAHSIEELGILEPLLVRPLNDGYYELIAGERRFRASNIAGLKEVPCIVKEMNDETIEQVRLIENLQREDLNAYEETIGILKLLALRLKTTQGETVALLNRMEKIKRKKEDTVRADNVIRQEETEVVESVFALIGRLSAESFRTNRLPLLNLPSEIQQALAEGKIEYTKARAIGKLKLKDKRQLVLLDAIEQNLSLSEIQKKIREILSEEKENSSPSLKQEYKELSKQLGASKIWDDPKKKKTLESLLARIKTLLED